MQRVYNFSAGPSCLPVPVLEKAAVEMLNYKGKGMSVMEMSHRSKMYLEIFSETECLLRELMKIPESYKVLFLQGGATLQFSMVPMNLMRNSKVADYGDTGMFANKALKEAKKFGKVNTVFSSKDGSYSYIPDFDSSMFTRDADYFHICTNNTICGTRYTRLPETCNVPLVADMSSNILSQVYDVSQFGLIYAGAQKNIGPAGLTIVIIREDLIGYAAENTPAMLDYKQMADNESMLSTPPTYGIYMAKLVFEWLKELGGVPAIERINIEKAAILYDYLDNSSLFKATAKISDRSLMNVTFLLPTDELNTKFVKEAAANGFVNLAGHRSVGGMRASIYNPMPVDGIKELVVFMKKFEVENR